MAAKRIEIIDPCTSTEWMRFICSHPDAVTFHHPSWMNMLKDIYRYSLFAVCVTDQGCIRAGIPFAGVRSPLTGKRWISLPFSDHCKPLFPRDDDGCAEELIDFLATKQRSEIPKIEIRWDVPSHHKVFYDTSFVLHTLKLEKDPEAVSRAFERHTALRSIAKAQKEGVVVREAKTLDDFYKFYMLQVKTRRRLGVPAQPKRFFEGVWKHIIEPGLGFVLIAYKDETPIGGGVFFKFGKTICYKYSASDFTYKHLQPTHAFVWEAIRRSCAEGYELFDFGRSEKEADGLRRFKRTWGATEQPLAYTIIADALPKPGSSKLQELVGMVIKNSPDVVCKLSGELLYKHFA